MHAVCCHSILEQLVPFKAVRGRSCHAQGKDADYLGDGGRRQGGQEGSAQARKPEQALGGQAQKKSMKRPAAEQAHAAAKEAQQPKRSRLTEDDGTPALRQQAAAPSAQDQVLLF